jgi:hypothetical protein
MANKGQHIIIKRGSKQGYALTPVAADDLYFNSRMVARIKESQRQIQDGKGIVIQTKEELKAFFDAL